VDPLRDADRVVRALDVLEEDRELVAAEAGDRVLRPHTRPQPLGHRHQQTVARQVAQSVVDVLETIQVEDEGAEWPALAPRPLQGVAQPVQEERAVRQAGEAVVKDGVAKVFFRLLALGDVEGDADGTGDRAPAVPKWLDVRLERAASPFQVVVHRFAPEGALVGGDGRKPGVLGVQVLEEGSAHRFVGAPVHDP